jgi:hypothetical protein
MAHATSIPNVMDEPVTATTGTRVADQTARLAAVMTPVATPSPPVTQKEERPARTSDSGTSRGPPTVTTPSTETRALLPGPRDEKPLIAGPSTVSSNQGMTSAQVGEPPVRNVSPVRLTSDEILAVLSEPLLRRSQKKRRLLTGGMTEKAAEMLTAGLANPPEPTRSDSRRSADLPENRERERRSQQSAHTASSPRRDDRTPAPAARHDHRDQRRERSPARPAQQSSRQYTGREYQPTNGRQPSASSGGQSRRDHGETQERTPRGPLGQPPIHTRLGYQISERGLQRQRGGTQPEEPNSRGTARGPPRPPPSGSTKDHRPSGNGGDRRR